MNKQPLLLDELFILHGPQVIELSGPDAVKFAQAQLTNDVAALPDGHWQWGGWLTPKGRLIALLIVLKLGSDRVWLLPQDADAQALVERLRQFVFRSKVALSVRDDLHVNAGFAAPTAATGAASATLDDGNVELDLSAQTGQRVLVISRVRAADTPAARLRWLAFDLAHGVPHLPPGQSEQWTPQHLSLDRLNAYSVRKGCYPGQEIVARTHFLGQAKRGLVRLQGSGVPELGEVLAEPVSGQSQPGPTGTLGQLISHAGDEGLAVLVSGAGPGPFRTGNAPAQVLPLLDGLQR